MKTILFLFISFLPLQAFALEPTPYNCDLEKPIRIAKVSQMDPRLKDHDRVIGELFKCQSQNKKVFYVAKLKGSSEEINYAHGRLMPLESENGVIAETIDYTNYTVDQMPFATRQAVHSILECLSKTVLHSTSKEFQKGVSSFYKGYKDGLYYGNQDQYGNENGQSPPRRKPKWSEKKVQFAAVGIEVVNILDGFNYQGTFHTAGDLLTTCPVTIILGGGLGTIFGGVFGSVKSLIRGVFHNRMGCTGLVVPGQTSENVQLTPTGELYHARNLDADLVSSWNKTPVFFYIEERGHLKYAAAGSAGLIYPGGISGFNEKGISVSTHQMYSAKYNISVDKAEIAPFLLQNILRKASSIKEAIKIAQDTQHFASWTFLVTDSKTNEVVSIEVSAESVRVVERSAKNKVTPVAQSNHFFHPDMKEDLYFPNNNKQIETFTRLSVLNKDISRMLEKAKNQDYVTLNTMMEKMSGHDGGFDKGLQAFGRTPTKAYSILTTIAVPNRSEFWMTSGDFLPAPHGTYLGFKMDFKKNKISYLGNKREHAFDKQRGHWVKSLSPYVQARVAYNRGQLNEALQFIEQAIQTAAENNVEEVVYRYMYARLLSEMGNYQQADEQFDLAFESPQLIDHQKALTAMFQAVNAQHLDGLNKKIKPRLQFAKNIFSHTTNMENSQKHFETVDNLEMIEKLLNGEEVEHSSLDWVVVR